MIDVKRIDELARQRGKAFKVLIVDDEPRIRDVFREFCGLTGSVEVDTAGDGQEAIDKVRNSEYDLVTMDLIMPEMSGVDAVAKIKEINPHLPVIVITGNATERLIKQAGLKGASSLLYKPVMMENFVDEVISTFEKSLRS